jgi:hypothetical protein
MEQVYLSWKFSIGNRLIMGKGIDMGYGFASALLICLGLLWFLVKGWEDEDDDSQDH